jgi:hypothetical protein
MKLKYSGTNEGIVYYLVAFITVVTLISYIYAGEVVPLVGFLLGSALVYSLYPNKSIALVSGILIAAMLRTVKREGYEDKEKDKEEMEDEEPTVEGNTMQPPKEKEKKGMDENMTKLLESAMKTAAKVDPNVETQKVPFENKGQGKLSPAELSGTDMEQLSNIIDKTTDLIKMLPEGFLSKV